MEYRWGAEQEGWGNCQVHDLQIENPWTRDGGVFKGNAGATVLENLWTVHARTVLYPIQEKHPRCTLLSHLFRGCGELLALTTALQRLTYHVWYAYKVVFVRKWGVLRLLSWALRVVKWIRFSFLLIIIIITTTTAIIIFFIKWTTTETTSKRILLCGFELDRCKQRGTVKFNIVTI